MGWNLPPGCTDRDIDIASGALVQCDNCGKMFDPDEEGCFIGNHKRFGDCCQCAECREGFASMTDPRNEYEKLGEELHRWETRAEELCKQGYRVSVMLTIERIIADNKLDQFPKLEAAE